MAYDHRQKCSTADSIDPLFDFGILQNVLSYVGLGHHLFVAPVSKLWRDLYSMVQTHQLKVSKSRKRITCVLKMTLCSSVYASPSGLRLAHENGFGCITRKHQLAAGRYADVATLASAHELGIVYTAAVMAGAAHYNKLAEVQYLHSQGCPWSRTLLEGAAVRGHFELARWCHEHGCPCPVISKATVYAAKSGNVELMAWVLQLPGAQLSKHLMSTAACHGHIAMCQFLHARRGHVDLLCWLMNTGCPWVAKGVCLVAARSGSIDVMYYLQQQGLLNAAMLRAMLKNAGIINKLAAAKWLKEQGAEWPTAFNYKFWGPEVLAWARAEGCTKPTN
jgi:hypothetical protein